MDDLISRKAAIEAICKSCSIVGDYHKCDGYHETSTWCDDLVALRAVPSAQPERKKGKWINVNDGKWNTFEVLKCSVCGELDNRMDWTDNFCPNCGADMRGDTDEQTD